MTHAILILSAIALLASGAMVSADDRRPPFSREAQIEGRSWSVGGYTKHTYKGRDSRGNRIGGVLEELPSGSFKFKSWSKPNPVPERVQRFLESRK